MVKRYKGKHYNNNSLQLAVTKAVVGTVFVSALALAIPPILSSYKTGANVAEDAKSLVYYEETEEREIDNTDTIQIIWPSYEDDFELEEEHEPILVEEYKKVDIPEPSIVQSDESFEIPSINDVEVIEEEHELTREDKLAIIYDVHGIDEFEYYQIVSTVAHEAGPSNYDECYDVLCTAYNRTLSKAWCWSCKQETGNDGFRIIDQFRWIGQFSGFLPNKAGYDRDEYEGTMADEATLDFLFEPVRTHDYTCFNAPWYEKCPSSAVQLHPECKGNKYFRLLTEDDLNEKALELGITLGKGR